MGSVTTYNEGKHNPNVLHIRRDLWEQTVEDVKKLKEECNKLRREKDDDFACGWKAACNAIAYQLVERFEKKQ